MAFRCGAPTSSGEGCRSIVCQDGSKCGWHTVVPGDDPQCSVCMEDIFVRSCKKLPCDHNFHKKCLEKWKVEGNRSCPLCRQAFDLPQFRVSIHIEPVNGAEAHNRARSFHNPEVRHHLMDRSSLVSSDPDIRTELTVESEDIQSLRRVLEQIGVSLTEEDYNSLSSVPHNVSEF